MCFSVYDDVCVCVCVSACGFTNLLMEVQCCVNYMTDGLDIALQQFMAIGLGRGSYAMRVVKWNLFVFLV